jgi:hypothetical protein
MTLGWTFFGGLWEKRNGNKSFVPQIFEDHGNRCKQVIYKRI